MRVSLALAVAAVVLACCGGNARAGAAIPTLYVQYAMNCTFTITDDARKTVTTIAPGEYQVAIATPSDFAGEVSLGPDDFTGCKGFVQFQLTGPGVNISTTLDDGDGNYGLFTEKFKLGSTYIARDNNQPSVARRVFKTRASGAPVTADVVRGALNAVVNTRGKVSLSRNGKLVATLRGGKWTFSVADQSKKAGFSLQALNGKAMEVTDAAFIGYRVLSITLTPGRWSFFTVGGTKSTFSVVR
jgi:hypothetical protein